MYIFSLDMIFKVYNVMINICVHCEMMTTVILINIFISLHSGLLYMCVCVCVCTLKTYSPNIFQV